VVTEIGLLRGAETITIRGGKWDDEVNRDAVFPYRASSYIGPAVCTLMSGEVLWNWMMSGRMWKGGAGCECGSGRLKTYDRWLSRGL